MKKQRIENYSNSVDDRCWDTHGKFIGIEILEMHNPHPLI